MSASGESIRDQQKKKLVDEIEAISKQLNADLELFKAKVKLLPLNRMLTRGCYLNLKS